MPAFRDIAPGADADDEASKRAQTDLQKAAQNKLAMIVFGIATFLALVLLLAALAPRGHPTGPDFAPPPQPQVLSLTAVLAGRPNPCFQSEPEQALKSYGRVYILCSNQVTVRP